MDDNVSVPGQRCMQDVLVMQLHVVQTPFLSDIRSCQTMYAKICPSNCHNMEDFSIDGI